MPSTVRTHHLAPVTGLALALIPAVAGTRRGLVVPGLRLSEVLIFMLLTGLLVSRSKRFWIGGKVLLPLILWATSTLLLVSYHISSKTDFSVGQIVDSAFGPTLLLFVYLIASQYRNDQKVLSSFIRCYLLISAAMGLLGLMQILKVQAVLNLASSLTGNTYIAQPLEWKVPRSVGIFNSWHAYAGFMCFALVLCVACFVRDRRIFRSNPVMLVVAGSIFSGLLSSLTFGTIGVGIAIGAVFLWRGKRRKWILAGSVVVLLVYFFSPVSENVGRRIELQAATVNDYGFLPQTVAFRLDLWLTTYVPLISDNLWIGNGPPDVSGGQFQYLESMYIAVAVYGGLLLLSLFLLFLIMAVRHLMYAQLCHDDDLRATVATASAAFLVGLAVVMIIHPYLNDAGASQALFVVLGLTATDAASHRRKAGLPTRDPMFAEP